MKKGIVLFVFLCAAVFCKAQINYDNPSVNLRTAPQIYTIDQHIDWVVNSYTEILGLNPYQKQTVYNTILEAYKYVPTDPMYPKLKTEFDMQMYQAVQIHRFLEPKFKEILTAGQQGDLKKTDPRPEDCFSLSKDYKLYASSISK